MAIEKNEKGRRNTGEWVTPRASNWNFTIITSQTRRIFAADGGQCLPKSLQNSYRCQSAILTCTEITCFTLVAKPFQVRVTDLKEETANVTSPRDEAETKKNKNWKIILFLFLSYSYFISLISGTIPAVGPRTLCMLGSSTTEPLSRAPHWCTPGALLIHAVRTFFTGTPPLGQNSNPTILFVAFSASETLPQKTIFFFSG